MGGYALAQTSLAHTYGNVASFITEYITGMFPPNFFNSVNIDTKLLFREFSMFQNSKKEFIRKSKPYINIKPRVELDDADTFLHNTLLTTRMTDNYMDTSFTNLQEFMFDSERGNSMKFLLNRLSLYFDVTIVVETTIEQLNIAQYLKNTIRQDMPFFLHTSLESNIPRAMIEVLCEDVGIPAFDKNGSVKPFLDYLNGISKYPISYKMKNSTANDEFFRYYPVNIDTIITGLSINDRGIRGMVPDSCEITFTVRTEFNATGLYYYFTDNPNITPNIAGSMVTKHSNEIIPLFTISNLHTEKLGLGWNLYTAPIFKTDPNAKERDITDIKSLFNNSVTRIIEYHKSNGIPYELFMKVFVMKNNTAQHENDNYIINFDDYTLTTIDPDPDATYRLIIHINTLYVNQMLDRLLSLSEEK